MSDKNGNILEEIANLKSEATWGDQKPLRLYLTEENAWVLFKLLKDSLLDLSIEEKQERHEIYVGRDTERMKSILDTSKVLGLKITVIYGMKVV